MFPKGHRFFGLIEVGGVVNGISSKDPILYTPTASVTFTQTDLADWQKENKVWYSRKVNGKVVHVSQVEERNYVHVEGVNLNGSRVPYYDTFVEAIVRGQIEIDKLSVTAVSA